MQPTLALAVEDYLPVILSFLALLWLAEMALKMHRPAGYIAAAGLTLVSAGGFLKATDKLIWVITGQGVAWMNNSLFLLLGPGFVCLGWALWCGQEAVAGRSTPRHVWLAPAVIIALALGSAGLLAATQPGRGWFFVMLTFTVLATIVAIALLIRQAWQQKMPLVGLSLLVYLFVTLALNGMARAPSETLAAEWIKQIVNTLAAAIFAYSAYYLSRATIRRLLVHPRAQAAATA